VVRFGGHNSVPGVMPQPDIELLFERMAVASDFALSAISEGVLCKIAVDPLGLVVEASHGKGEKRLSLRKIVGYDALKSAEVDVLYLAVYDVLKTLMNEVKSRARQ